MATAFRTKATSDQGGDFELPESGTYPAVCVGLIDLGTHENTFNGQTTKARKLFIVWELSGEHDSKGRPFVVSQSYTWSLNKKAKLRPLIEAWTGRTLADNEEVDLGDILGKPCTLTLTIGTSGAGKKFVEIGGIGKPMKGMAINPPSHEPFGFALAEQVFSDAGPEIPDWIPPNYGRKVADEIKNSEEWSNLSPF